MPKPIEHTMSTVNAEVNYGLWMVIMRQCRFILGKKCATLVSDVGNGRGYVFVEAEGIWEVSVPPYQFCGKPKTTLKI